MTKARTKRVLALMAITISASIGAVPPSAVADGVTPLAFVGEASLPAFPCDPAGAIVCAGNFGGSISGELAGEQFGAWTATLGDANLNATFTYDDAAGHCTTGTAVGTATVTAGIGEVVGTYNDPDLLLPRAVSGLWAQVDFTWDRVGSSAVLTLGNGRVRLNILGVGWMQVMTEAVGTAAATFVPELDADDLPDCVEFTNAPPITARVLGTAALADPR